MSSRTRGSDHAEAIALAVIDLPQPGTPVTSTPFGAGRPYARASSIHDPLRLRSQVFRFSRPPMSSSPIDEDTTSSTPDFCTICFFSSCTSTMS